MKHTYRFIAHKNPKSEWIISDDECVHLKKVLRLKEGDEVEAIDGSGSVVIGKISSIGSKEALIDADKVTLQAAEEYPVHVLAGALRHGMADDLIAPLVEVGVDAVTFFGQTQTEKSRLSDKALSRWRNIAKGATKQTKTAFFTTIETRPSLKEALVGTERYTNKIYFSEHVTFNALDLELKPGPTITVLGSELGINEAEMALLKDYDFIPVSLGPNILRAVTAVTLGGALLTLKRQKMRDS